MDIKKAKKSIQFELALIFIACISLGVVIASMYYTNGTPDTFGFIALIISLITVISCMILIEKRKKVGFILKVVPMITEMVVDEDLNLV